MEQNYDLYIKKNSEYKRRTLFLSTIFFSLFFIGVPLVSSKKNTESKPYHFNDDIVYFEQLKEKSQKEAREENDYIFEKIYIQDNYTLTQVPLIAPQLDSNFLSLEIYDTQGLAVTLEHEATADDSHNKPILSKQSQSSKEAKVNIPSQQMIYDKDMVDVAAKRSSGSYPRYPRLALRKKQEGHVKISCIVKKNGQLDQLEIIESSPTGVFDAVSLRAFKQWRFTPAQKDGEFVDQKHSITFNFNLN
ncbi:MAG: energy transducer TonB [Lentisphaeria bacterium]|nr:energy transducer TonB [Lentisphaeria bacterium]